MGDLEAGEVSPTKLQAGITIAEHYAAEALRLVGASRVGADLIEAQKLLAWLQSSWWHPVVSLPDIYRLGPGSIRHAASARRAVGILVDHGWLVLAPPCEIEGVPRREVWRIIRG